MYHFIYLLTCTLLMTASHSKAPTVAPTVAPTAAPTAVPTVSESSSTTTTTTTAEPDYSAPPTPAPTPQPIRTVTSTDSAADTTLIVLVDVSYIQKYDTLTISDGTNEQTTTVEAVILQNRDRARRETAGSVIVTDPILANYAAGASVVTVPTPACRDGYEPEYVAVGSCKATENLAQKAYEHVASAAACQTALTELKGGLAPPAALANIDTVKAKSGGSSPGCSKKVNKAKRHLMFAAPAGIAENYKSKYGTVCCAPSDTPPTPAPTAAPTATPTAAPAPAPTAVPACRDGYEPEYVAVGSCKATENLAQKAYEHVASAAACQMALTELKAGLAPPVALANIDTVKTKSRSSPGCFNNVKNAKRYLKFAAPAGIAENYKSKYGTVCCAPRTLTLAPTPAPSAPPPSGFAATQGCCRKEGVPLTGEYKHEGVYSRTTYKFEKNPDVKVSKEKAADWQYASDLGYNFPLKCIQDCTANQACKAYEIKYYTWRKEVVKYECEHHWSVPDGTTVSKPLGCHKSECGIAV